MVLFLGMFLINTLCVFVPCSPVYEPPVPVPFDQGHPSYFNHYRMNFNSEPHPIVDTLNGLVRGFRMKTIRARNIFAFTGIPFAEPPLGDLRYAPPKEKKHWKGTFDATQNPSECLQVDGMQLLRIVGSEDCLYLNVFTPMLPKTRHHPNLPVIVYIHGGSFAFSSGTSFGPSYLLDRDVILVTFNYRLSSLGFLSTGDSVAPGNWGLKDQVMALRWVTNNIFSFGGNPVQITLMGQSAGAVSVHLHMMSKQSRGLFRGGISQSGNAFCFWGVRQDSVDFTYRLASSLRCPVNDTKALVECMRKLDPHLISYHETILPEYKVFPGVFFGPVVEPEDNDDAFLVQRPEECYARNQVSPVPWINGFLADEGNGVGFLTYLYPFVIQEVDSRWSELGPKILDIKGERTQISKVANSVRQFYLGDRPINFENRKQFTNMIGDRLITSGVERGLQFHARVAPTYGYFFNYTGRYGNAAIYGLNNAEWGISHDDDLIYLLNSTSYHALAVGDPEYEMSEFLTNVWSNFAAMREPVYTTDDNDIVPFWEPIHEPHNMKLALLNGDVPEMIPIPFKERIQFWNKLDLVTGSGEGGKDNKLISEPEPPDVEIVPPMSNSLWDVDFGKGSG